MDLFYQPSYLLPHALYDARLLVFLSKCCTFPLSFAESHPVVCTRETDSTLSTMLHNPPTFQVSQVSHSSIVCDTLNSISGNYSFIVASAPGFWVMYSAAARLVRY